MYSLTHNGIKLRLYTDWVEFFSLHNCPFDSEHYLSCKQELRNEKGQQCFSTGFAGLDDKIIRVLALPNCPFLCLFETISHELGHLIEGGFKKNPPIYDPKYNNKHEEKAEHYEKFAMNCYALTNKTLKKLEFIKTLQIKSLSDIKAGFIYAC